MEFVRSLRSEGETVLLHHGCRTECEVLCLEEDLDQLVPLFEQDYRIIVSKTKDLSHED